MLEAVRIVRPGAFVQKAGEKCGRARTVRRILRCAAIDREFERDQGNRVLFDKPRFNSARRKNPLDTPGA